MNDLNLALMSGIDIPIPELQLIIHPPTIKDIAFMGEEQFFTSVQYICLEKEQLIQDKTLLSTMTNFQVLMKVLAQSQDKSKKDIIQTFLLLLFPNYKIVMLPSSIIFSQQDQQPIIIDDNNFDIFQSYIKKVLCVNNIFQGDNIIYKPSNDLAKKIADKIMEGKRKVAQQRAMENGGKKSSILTRYISILTVSKVIDLHNATSLTLFQLFDIMERYTAFTEWDIDLRVRLAGGKPEKRVDSWMRDMHPLE